mgnify:CR=1 FL=1
MIQPLETRPFGKTGERVTVIGLGGAHLDRSSLADGEATVHRALELGINYFDSAPGYGQGASQVILGKALERHKEPYLLATKLACWLPSFTEPEGYWPPEVLHAQLRENLRLLRRSKVDILQVHMAEYARWWKHGAQPDQLLGLNETYDFSGAPVMRVLREAKATGLCRFIGITGDHPDELAYALRHVDVDVCLSAWNYNLLFRRTRRTILPLAQEKGVAYIVAGILGYFTEVHPEWLSAPPLWVTPEVKIKLAGLYELQKASGLSLVNIAVRYMLADQSISTVLVGAKNPAELEECVAAAKQGPLPSDLHRAIEELGLYNEVLA